MVALSTAQHQLLDPSQHVVTATDQQVVQTLSDFLPNRIIDIHTHLYLSLIHISEPTRPY